MPQSHHSAGLLSSHGGGALNKIQRAAMLEHQGSDARLIPLMRENTENYGNINNYTVEKL